MREVSQVLETSEQQIRDVGSQQDPEDTDTVCRHILISLYSIIRSLYTLMEQREYLSTGILMRSLTEYFIDALFIKCQDNRKYNSQFVKYPILIRYWYIPHLESFKDQTDKLAAEYQAYVETQFPEIKSKISKKSKPQMTSAQVYRKIDKKIKDKYKRGWSGLTLAQRIQTVRDKLGNQSTFAAFLNAYKFHSQHTHATAYSTLLQTHPTASADADQRAESDFDLQQLERNVCLVIMTIRDAFPDLFQDAVEDAFIALMKKYIQDDPELRKEYERHIRHAARPGHK